MRFRLACLIVAVFSAFAAAQSTPQITGVAGATFYVSSLDKAKQFYGDYLGYDVAVYPPEKALVRVSDRQSIVLLHDSTPGDRLGSVTFETNDAEALRSLLASHGVAVPAKLDPIPTDGPATFKIMDSDGHVLEFM